MNIVNEKYIPWLIFLAVVLVYLAFPTKNYYWDGVHFAQTIESAGSLNSSLIHPNHLIYNALGYLVYKLVNGVGFHVRALTILQIMSSLTSGLCSFVLFHILKLSLRSTYLAAVLTMLFAFSATWWKFSTDANAYIPATLFLLISFYLANPNNKPGPFAVALAHTLSMMFHQLAVFFFPIIVLGILLQTPAEPLKNRLRLAAQYAVTAFLLTFGTFCLCFYLQTGTLNFRSLLSWLTSYSPEIGFVFNAKESFLYTFRGHTRLLFGGRFNFLKEVINPFTIALTIILVLSFAALIIQLIRSSSSRSKDKTEKISDYDIHFKPLVLLCCTWAGVYIVFLFFWIPQNTFYRLFYLPALVLLVGLLLKRYAISDNRKWRTALFVAVLALSNFLFLIYPYARVRNNTPLYLAYDMNKVWSQKTVIYFDKLHSDNELIKYFNPSTTWKKLEASRLEEFENELREVYANGGTAWLDTSAVKQISQQAGGAEWLKTHTDGQSQYKLTDPAYDVSFVQVFPRL